MIQYIKNLFKSKPAQPPAQERNFIIFYKGFRNGVEKGCGDMIISCNGFFNNNEIKQEIIKSYPMYTSIAITGFVEVSKNDRLTYIRPA